MSRYFDLSIDEDPRFHDDPEQKRILEERIDNRIIMDIERREREKDRALIRQIQNNRNGEIQKIDPTIVIVFVLVLIAFAIVTMPTLKNKFAAKKVRRKSRHTKRV